MGPRRTPLALALLALGLLVVSAGAAMASSDSPWSTRPLGPTPRGADVVRGAASGRVQIGYEVVGDASPRPPTGPDVSSAGGDITGGGVTGASVDIASAPVRAPAATASGPAPDAVAPAPIVFSALEIFAPVNGAPGLDLGALAATADVALPAVALPAVEVAAPVAEFAAPVAEVAEVAAPVAEAVGPVNEPSLAELPSLGSIGALATRVPDGPSTARALLTTRTGRSVAVLVALLAAIVAFLSIHRRVDRGDPKLASARTGPDVARFR